jgi:pimeloyl-ACP methyl ester carboxylesterase
MPKAQLHDGSLLDVEIHGDGPAVLLPVNPRPVDGPQADEMRRWGADPALGRSLVDGLAGEFRVVAADYEGHVLAVPKPATLTPDNVVNDLLAVADAAGADRFAYYGYSWLALVGLQLAIRTDRLTALAMGGFPPLGGPYAEMLRVTTATHEMATHEKATHEKATHEKATHEMTMPPAPGGPSPVDKPEPASDAPDWSSVEVTLSPAQTGQFVTLYQALRGFDDRAAQSRVTCPRLCFAGACDDIDYGQRWGGVHVSMARPLIAHRAELAASGWAVELLDGLDHTGAMQAANVLPILRPWLGAAVAG